METLNQQPELRFWELLKFTGFVKCCYREKICVSFGLLLESGFLPVLYFLMNLYNMYLKLQHDSSLEEIYSLSHSLVDIHGESIVSCLFLCDLLVCGQCKR